MRKRIHPNWLVHGYFLLTIAGLLQLYFYADMTILMLFGFHTSAYGFFLALLFGELGFRTLAIISFVFWPILICLFVISYVLAVWKKQYRLFTALVIIDMMISFLLFLRYLQVASYGYMFRSAMGIIISMVFGLYTIKKPTL